MKNRSWDYSKVSRASQKVGDCLSSLVEAPGGVLSGLCEEERLWYFGATRLGCEEIEADWLTVGTCRDDTASFIKVAARSMIQSSSASSSCSVCLEDV